LAILKTEAKQSFSDSFINTYVPENHDGEWKDFAQTDLFVPS
tara:strand:+ start:341 stop:466 length:126 start_codon:yes stop_codon:yes gene_type:complete